MTRPWPEVVVDAAISGDPSRLPGDRLDDLLAWLLERDQPGTRLLSEQFDNQGVRREQAVQLSLALLDELLSHGEAGPLGCLGFSEKPEQETLRRRYRRLQQIFHPDRQFGGEAWATERSEAINSAYRKIKDGRESDTGPVVSPSPPATPSAADIATANGYTYPRRRFADRLRSRMGSANKVQRAAVAGLLLVSVTGLALTYLAYRSDISPAVSAPDSSSAGVAGNLAGHDGSDGTPPRLPVALTGKPDEAVKDESREHSSSEASGADVETNAPVAYGLAPTVSAPAERWREASPPDPPDAALLATPFFLDPPMPGMVRERPGPLTAPQRQQAGSWPAPANAAPAAVASAMEPDPASEKNTRPAAYSESADGSTAPAVATAGSENRAAAEGEHAGAGSKRELDSSAETENVPASSDEFEPRPASDGGKRNTQAVAGKPESPDRESVPAGKERGALPDGPRSPATAPEAGAVAAAEHERATPDGDKDDAAKDAEASKLEPSTPTDSPDAGADNTADGPVAAPEDTGRETGKDTAGASGDRVVAAPGGPGNAAEQGSEGGMATAALDPCRGYSQFLRRYEDAYNRGHLDRLLDLYAHDARENQLNGLAAIAETYRQFFDDTRGRRIAIAVTGVEAREDQCRVRGEYRVNYRTDNGRRRETDGIIVAHLVDPDTGLRIAEIRY